jgi:hypothetical protein
MFALACFCTKIIDPVVPLILTGRAGIHTLGQTQMTLAMGSPYTVSCVRFASKNNFLIVGHVRFALDTVFLILNVFASLRK